MPGLPGPGGAGTEPPAALRTFEGPTLPTPRQQLGLQDCGTDTLAQSLRGGLPCLTLLVTVPFSVSFYSELISI